MKSILLTTAVAALAFSTGYLVNPQKQLPDTSLADREATDDAHAAARQQAPLNIELPDTFRALAAQYPGLAENHLELNRVLYGMTLELVESDPATAASLLDQFTDENARLGAQELVLAIWSEQDPANALKWLAQRQLLYGKEQYEGYYAYALSSLAMLDPEQAVVHFHTLEPGSPARRGIIEGITQGWGQSDPQAGFAWLEQIQDLPDVDDQLLNEAYTQLMMGYMHLDRDAAAATIAQLDSSRLRAELVRPLVLKYAETGFEDAVNFINSLEDPLAQRYAAAQFVEVEGPNHPSQMIDFAINNMDLDSGDQTFLRHAFMTLTMTDTDEAMAHYQQLTGASRNAAMEAIAYSVWQMKGPNGVELWIESLPDRADRDDGYAALALHAADNPDRIFASLAQISDPSKKVTTLESIVTQVAPNQLFDIKKLLPDTNLEPQQTEAISAIINERITNEYGALLVPPSV
ncbi:hypothetical protein [Coraliomargarita akajimensis]|uniref:Uncharacterized protein n=1 Tax=Coraliomargarita akajimensis (strain DSM 45221 / IAM 15411 / JCM 23193 / KCTC 12865 / 04OKA010-24) TaxID=583355 RepID=D5EQ81_CORAD|nr:hypothetical protein [Coraliomargarita akajimensis]ADE53849.1 hypothetical protein Caka_0825 [Coraliomargarita akajimensis DSM 45221]